MRSRSYILVLLHHLFALISMISFSNLAASDTVCILSSSDDPNTYPHLQHRRLQQLLHSSIPCFSFQKCPGRSLMRSRRWHTESVCQLLRIDLTFLTQRRHWRKPFAGILSFRSVGHIWMHELAPVSDFSVYFTRYTPCEHSGRGYQWILYTTRDSHLCEYRVIYSNLMST
jgi:hypothetical protein